MPALWILDQVQYDGPGLRGFAWIGTMVGHRFAGMMVGSCCEI